MKENILKELQPFAVDIDALTIDPNNARLHPERNIETIKKSLEKFGQHRLAVCQKTKNGLVVRIGNGMVQAARELGWRKIAVLAVTENDTEAMARALVDNRTSDLSEFDLEILNLQLDELKSVNFDIGELGFDLLTATFEPNLGDDDGIKPSPENKLLVIVACKNEDEQNALFHELRERGLKVRV